MGGPKVSSFQYYLGGLGSSAVAMGLQVVIFPWLVVGVLHEPADRVGLAQMAVMLPNLLLIYGVGPSPISATSAAICFVCIYCIYCLSA